MIAWMQKHNKYLVVTIWIATIAFIGAGFVGWGTYQYGSGAGSVAQVGEIRISQEKFNFTYQNLYRQYAEMARGNFDDAKAKEIGLPKEAYRRLVTQALLLNLAREYGIIVSEKELADAIVRIPAFQERGVFSRKIYTTFLDARGMKPRSFEKILRDDLLVEKLMGMLNAGPVPFETKVVASALGISDKISYEVVTSEDLNITADPKEIRTYWEANRERYKTPRLYRLAVLWTDLSDINVSDTALRDFYRKNSFNYTDASGKEQSFEEARRAVERDFRITKGKKKALLDYIALKKGKKAPSEIREVPENDPLFPPAVWEKIKSADKGSLLKPKAVGERYVSFRIDGIILPRPMSFEEASRAAERDWMKKVRAEALSKKAQHLLKEKKALKHESGYLSLTQSETLSPLSQQESLQFLQKLFTSNEKEGIIDVHGKKVVYRITDQKIGKATKEMDREMREATGRIKKGEFEASLLSELSRKYPVKSFVKGF